MANLFKYRFIQTLREKGNMFWGLAFPIILGTFFYFAFGSLGTETWNNIPVAVVEASSNEAFSQYMDALDGDLLDITCMSEQEAENALQEGTVTGIFYEETEPSLTVAANGMEETMLSSLMDSYAKNASMIADILQTHPENLQTALSELSDYSSFTENSSLGGRTYDNVLDYFFALIAMGCFYGSFLGISLANENMANMSPLGARRSSAPVSKLKLVAVDMGTGFLIHFINVVLLLCYLNFVLKIDFSGELGRYAADLPPGHPDRCVLWNRCWLCRKAESRNENISGSRLPADHLLPGRPDVRQYQTAHRTDLSSHQPH